MNLICGIDEAGRGSVFGPLVICGVCFLDSKADYLKKIGVKDSKKLSSKKRNELALKIIEHCYSMKVLEITPKEIDKRVSNNLNLNKLEVIKMAQILNLLKPTKVFIDAADVNESRFTLNIKYRLSFNPKHLISKHKADVLYPIVSAASIIAKVKRDEAIALLSEKYGDIGSGYPSDIKSVSYLRNYIEKYKKVPEFVRKSWETTKRMMRVELDNRKITEFFHKS